MGHNKEAAPDTVGVRICPKCSKAFFAHEDECATCYLCGTPVAEF